MRNITSAVINANAEGSHRRSMRELEVVLLEADIV
jgi:hypothetical protein